MSSFTKFNLFVNNLGKGHFNFGSDALKIMLSNVAPTPASNQLNTDITEIAAGNGYSAGGTAVGSVTWTDSSGTSTLAGNAVVFTASGGSIATFRYAVLYDSTTGYLIGYWDYGAGVTITTGNTFTVNENSVATGGSILSLG